MCNGCSHFELSLLPYQCTSIDQRLRQVRVEALISQAKAEASLLSLRSSRNPTSIEKVLDYQILIMNQNVTKENASNIRMFGTSKWRNQRPELSLFVRTNRSLKESKPPTKSLRWLMACWKLCKPNRLATTDIQYIHDLVISAVTTG